MIINTKSLDYSRFYRILNISSSGEPILVNAFLSNFYEHFNAFRASAAGYSDTGCGNDRLAEEAGKLKDFIIEAGGNRTAALLAEYEQNAAIGDMVSCREMEKNLFDELETFKEVVISMFS